MEPDPISVEIANLALVDETESGTFYGSYIQTAALKINHPGPFRTNNVNTILLFAKKYYFFTALHANDLANLGGKKRPF